jgi:hypothetical protein
MKSTSGARGAVVAAVGRLDGVAGSAWFAYGSILLIQAKVLWGIWEHRDLTGGDTTQYFIQASHWTHGFHLDPVWSPLYDFFWGSLRWFVDDPYASTILHRVLIVIAATVLVLAVLRRLLSPGIAWALAVWWAILPINYDVLYEVHLFALLPELLAVLIALTWTGLRMRAGVFTVLLAATVLMRNEVAVAVAVWTVAWILYEVRARRRGEGTEPRRLLRSAVLPTLGVAALTTAVALSSAEGHFVHRFNEHAELSNCQAYAAGYQQRNDDFKGNPFTGCARLMERDFGKPMPSMADAFRANPGAIGAHYLWNTRLLPYGLQLMLFDRISAGGQNRDPDYISVRARSSAAFVGSVLLIVFVAGGLVLLWRDRRRWWENWLADRAWGWMALGALAGTAVIAALWQRPRPEYLYVLSVGILALIGTCAMAYADRWPASKRIRAAIPIAALLLVVLLPAHFTSGYVTPQVDRPERPQKEMVDRLYPIRTELRGHEVKLLATSAGAGCAYLGGDDPCNPVFWKPILAGERSGAVAEALAARRVDFIYLDEVELQRPYFQEVVREAEAAGWTRAPISAGQPWLLLRRP